MLLYTLILIPFTPSISDITKATTERPAQILFADGKKMTEFKQSNREWVKLSQISPQVIDALISTEDQRFYEHHGLDWRRLASSTFHTLSGDRQGGSTITQQLARNLYPEEIGRAPTITRKLKEAITALKIESVHSKSEILETYLNTVPFLYNAFGIEMAARTYFGTSASSLNVLESATLVGMLKGNSYYNPVLNPERALERRNTVLAQMVKHQKLTTKDFEVLRKKPLGVDLERQAEPAGPAPHFAQQLRQWLIDWADRNDYNIYSDGLVVYTTLDSELQTQADQSVAHQGDQLQRLANEAWHNRSIWNAKNDLVQTFIRESPQYRTAKSNGLTDEQALKQLQADTAYMQKLYEQKIQIQAGFLAIDPSNGYIKAWVGSRDFAQDGFDHVQQARRQPGSTFKAFVYGEAFRQGFTPDDTLIDQAVEIPVSATEVWRPTDGKPPSGRAMTLRSALTYSKNTITAQLMQKVGPANVAKLARAMGVRQSKLEEVPSLALGTSPVTLKEMVTAYGTIANGGNYIEPVFVTRIEDRNGRVLEKFAPSKPEPVLAQNVAYTLLDVMRGVVDRGTGNDIRNRFGIYADVAGKTGTTQDNTDGWFILMHPQLVAGAWVGFNDGRVTLRSDYWGQGAKSALPIVGEFFRSALRTHVIDQQIRFGTPEQQAALRLPTPPVASEPTEQASEVAASSPAAQTDLPTQPETALPQNNNDQAPGTNVSPSNTN
ncbi:MAG: transglycosylase domain-containing protein [Formivibrio sp.]|nr:transglycosylase domain-containing protein [Formivibrio sp.]